MTSFRNDLDVTQTVRTTEPSVVNAEIDRVFLELYPDASTRIIDQAFADATNLFQGKFPGYQSCDTAYHDIQHTLDVTLAMARLIDGYERSRVRGARPLGEDLFQLGLVTALFHDCGYIRRMDDSVARNGAEYTLTHVSRGAQFLLDYLPRLGMGELAETASKLIHFTGYEMPVSKIDVSSPVIRLLGNLLGSADIIAQMADRCYLEKCRDRLYPEFVAGGIARRPEPGGGERVVFSSGEDLVMKTPGFYAGASHRLETDLAGFYKVAEHHFGGQNLYIDEVNKNIRFAQVLSDEGDTSALRRTPPTTLGESENRAAE